MRHETRTAITQAGDKEALTKRQQLSYQPKEEKKEEKKQDKLLLNQ